MIVAEPNAGSLKLSLREYRDKWCLYSHSIAPFKETFFLGICKLSDVYKFVDAYRNSHWRKTITADTIFKTSILATMDSVVEAQTALRTMFNEIRPECNIKGYQYSGRMHVICIEGENKGVTYKSAAEAALQNGISPGAMSNHLNGHAGYLTVKSMKFQRGITV